MSFRTSVSFVMPAFNCFGTIEESVESILNGNFQLGDELVIVDDCSTDETRRVLTELKQKYPIINIFYNLTNRGCPASRNIGIAYAKNALIFNLDSDNVLVPGSIEKLVLYLQSQNADLAAFEAMHFFIKNIGHVTHKWIFDRPVLTLADFLAGPYNPGPGGNFLFTKASWERVGHYWEYGLGLHEAWGFTLKQLADGSKFVIMPDSFYFHRHGHSSLFVRESKTNGENLMATKMLLPYLSRLEEKDALYIHSDHGANSWFTNLFNHPLKLKNTPIGKTGRVEFSWELKLKNCLGKIIKKFY